MQPEFVLQWYRKKSVLCFLTSGMCMCVRAWCDGSTGIPLVLAGFDDGSLLLWDVRRPSAEMTALKLFPEPGEISTTS